VVCVRFARSRRKREQSSVYAVVKVGYRLPDPEVGPDAVTSGVATGGSQESVAGDSANLNLR